MKSFIIIYLLTSYFTDSPWPRWWAIFYSFTNFGEEDFPALFLPLRTKLNWGFGFGLIRSGEIPCNSNIATDRFKIVCDLGHLMEFPWGRIPISVYHKIVFILWFKLIINWLVLGYGRWGIIYLLPPWSSVGLSQRQVPKTP